MAQRNQPKETRRTHEGAPAYHTNAEEMLRRSVLACLLWENQFYEDGESIADRIASTVHQVEPERVAALAIEAREEMKLRHVPLLLVRELARFPGRRKLVAETTERVIQRADEIPELLAIYADGRDGVKRLGKLSKGIQIGIARAFQKFDAYQLAKYDRAKAIRLRDALFLSHAKPRDEEQAALWHQLVDGTLPAPDTWEVALSSGGDKKDHWERLLTEKKLGALALLRNLRNMEHVDVDENLVTNALVSMKADRVLPFRFIAAARHAPRFEPRIEVAMVGSLEKAEKLPGKTALLIDHSGSMRGAKVSARSEIDRFDAAAGLAIIAREVCEDCRVWAFSDWIAEIPARRGFALRDAIEQAGRFWGTYLGAAVRHVNESWNYDRLIVVTDEQSHDPVGGPQPGTRGYMVNVASYQNGVGYGAWTHINGWSEAILRYVQATEAA
jgi:hypothetical protein